MSRFGVFNINGSEYDLDDLTLDEVEKIEDLCGGVAFSELNFGSAKAMKAISFTLMSRDHPDVTYEDVGSVKMLDMMPPDEKVPPLPPETEDGSQGDSVQDGSGPPPSLASIPG